MRAESHKLMSVGGSKNNRQKRSISETSIKFSIAAANVRAIHTRISVTHCA